MGYWIAYPFLVLLQLMRCWLIFFALFAGIVLKDEVVTGQKEFWASLSELGGLLTPGGLTFLQLVTLFCAPVIVWPQFSRAYFAVTQIVSVVVGLIFIAGVSYLHSKSSMGAVPTEISSDPPSLSPVHFWLTIAGLFFGISAFACAVYLALGLQIFELCKWLRWIMLPTLALFVGWRIAKEFFERKTI